LVLRDLLSYETLPYIPSKFFLSLLQFEKVLISEPFMCFNVRANPYNNVGEFFSHKIKQDLPSYHSTILTYHLVCLLSVKRMILPMQADGGEGGAN
jgi:hypothetical protein